MFLLIVATKKSPDGVTRHLLDATGFFSARLETAREMPVSPIVYLILFSVEYIQYAFLQRLLAFHFLSVSIKQIGIQKTSHYREQCILYRY